MQNLKKHRKVELPLWLKDFEPKIRFEHQLENFVVKTAETPAEVEQALFLRNEVFLVETGIKSETANPYEWDEFDRFCDHLVVVDQRVGRVVATYRFQFSGYCNSFYTATEYDLSRFLELEGSKLELGRACVARMARTGVVMDLLWQGLSTYIQKVRPAYLFGVSSVKMTDPSEALALSDYLVRRYNAATELVTPLPEFAAPKDAEPSTDLTDAELKSLIPPLLRSYLTAGAEIAEAPAIDKAFACTDYFTFMDLTKLKPSHRRRYFGLED